MASIKEAEKNYLGIDIGGTYAKIAVLNNGVFRFIDKIATGIHSSPDVVLNRIAERILKEYSEITSVGVGTAGLIDIQAGGLIKFSPNLPLWNKINVGKILKNLLRVPVIVNNDCNVFSIGAINSGIIPSDGLWLFVTLGTGIGGTIINQGKILYGSGHSGEFGHTTIQASGIPCQCGSDGCWEKYGGKEALIWYYTRLTGQRISPEELSYLASKGNIQAIEAFREYGRWIGIGMANLANCFSPMGFFIGGGLSATYIHFEDSARHEFQKRCKHPWNVTVLKDSPYAGAFGAASMAGNIC